MHHNPHIRWILRSIRLFREGKISSVGLAQNIEAERGALEGDVPRPVHSTLHNAVEAIQRIDFLLPEAEHDAELRKIVDEVEAAIGNFYPSQEDNSI